MSQQTINLGTGPNTGTGTPFRTAGGFINDNFTECYAAFPDPLVAYVRTSGSDTSGAVGLTSHPFQTIQAAFNAGATIFDLGVGNFGNLTLPASPANVDISIRGRGGDAGQTIIGTIAAPGGVYIHDFYKSVQIGSILSQNPGQDSGNISLSTAYVLTVNSSGSDGVNPGDNGTNAGTIFLSGSSYFSALIFSGGNGASGGNGGNGGALVARGPIFVTGAVTGIAGTAGDGGTDGADGTISASQIVDFSNSPNIGAGTPSYVGVIVGGVFRAS